MIRVFEVIDSRPLITEKPAPPRCRPTQPGWSSTMFTSGYTPGQPVLNGLTLRAEPGETLAIIGTSGSGKSTLSLLLARFYDVDSGAVRVGGHDAKDVTLDRLKIRDRPGAGGQLPVLRHGTGQHCFGRPTPPTTR